MQDGDNLSRPQGTARAAHSDDTFGRFSETVARFLGTGPYLVAQTVVVIIWIAFNLIAYKYRFDPYPFILLNLMFSTQAAYAAPLILLAQTRQTDRDRVQSERDREMNARSVASMDFLAREIAAIRIGMEKKIDREDFEEAMLRLQRALEHLPRDGEALAIETRFEEETPALHRPEQ